MWRRTLGDRGERRAESWLRKQGLDPIERNWSCRHGEIDLVMRDGEVVVFVEVRLRTPRGYASGAESVDWHKQRRLAQAASIFLARHPAFHSCPCRFDVIAIAGTDGEIEWIRNAFETEG